ncbi:BRO family protein [Clostridium cagae]|uniref:BRO family protein n=1 Tax=Clostridium cagae TaxID=2080751 RepID=UPI003F75F92B
MDKEILEVSQIGDRTKLFKDTELKLQVRTIQNDDGSISINAEDTAIGFGWTQTQNKNGKKYTSIRWETINNYCSEFGFPSLLGKDDYIPESLFYILGMKANNKAAQDFQKWLAVDVIPSLRKTGSYQNNNQKAINEFKGQLATLVNDMFEEKLSEVKEYYKIKSKSKSDLSSYIKKRLGILRADDEYEQVKARVFLIIGISKWEDLDVDSYKTILPVIDESIRIVKLDRPQQASFFDIA